MATLLHRVPVDRITAQARTVKFSHVLLTLIAAVLYAVGWAAGKVLGAIWLAIAWSGTAVKVGGVEARGGSG
jgi:hypothetical protein